MKPNLIESQSLALVSCSVTFAAGMPSTLPFFNDTGDLKFWGAVIVSPNTLNGD